MDIAETAKKLFNYSFVARSRSKEPRQSKRERRPKTRPSSSADERPDRFGRHVQNRRDSPYSQSSSRASSSSSALSPASQSARQQRELQRQPPPLPPLPSAANSPFSPPPPLQRPATSAGHSITSSHYPHPSHLSNAPIPAMSRSVVEPRPQTSRARLPVGYHNSPVITGNGVTVSIALAEPIMFLQGASNNVERQGFMGRKVAVLRGCLRVKITKPVKIKKIYLGFKGECSVALLSYAGQSHSSCTHERNSLLNHTWTFFNASFPDIDQGTNYADHIVTNINRPPPLPPSPKHSSLPLLSRLSLSSRRNGSSDDHSLSLQSTNRSHSVSKADHSNHNGSRGYKVFEEGEYHYNFEMPIDSTMPETFKTAANEARVRYDLEAIVERAGPFRPNLWGRVEVPVVRTLPESSLENVEPIAIIRNWEGKLRYEIMVSGKSFAMGSRVPIAFKLTPLDKVAVQRIRIFITEEYTLYSSNRAVRQRQERKRILLMEKRAGARSSSVYPGSTVRVITGGGLPVDEQMEVHGQSAESAANDKFVTNGNSLLGDLSGATDSMGCGPTELEFNMQLPICQLMHKKPPSEQIHTDTHTPMIEVSHTIRIVMRLSTPSPDPNKRRHFEISIDSPFHIRSCMTSTSNTSLPAYESPDLAGTSANQNFEVRPLVNLECNCRNALEDQLRDLEGTVSLPPAPALQPAPTITSQNSSAVGHAVGAAGLNIPAAGGLVAEPIYFDEQRPQQEQRPLRQRRPHTSATPLRPIHLIRAPSFAPPRFEDLSPAPPEQAVTPPPDYSSIVHSDDPIGDYHSRFQMFLDSVGQNGQEVNQVHGDRTRVDVPLTPGGRVHRSMDVPRDWPRLAEETGIAISTGTGTGGVRSGNNGDDGHERQGPHPGSGIGDVIATQHRDQVDDSELIPHAFSNDSNDNNDNHHDSTHGGSYDDSQR